MSENTRKMLTARLESTREMLAELWEAIDAPWSEDGENGEGVDRLENLPLEIVWEIGEPFAVVLGTGGPHIEITGGGRSGYYKLEGYWGSEHVTLSGVGDAITRTGEHFREAWGDQ